VKEGRLREVGKERRKRDRRNYVEYDSSCSWKFVEFLM
jgi:hypothetical protein